MKLWIMLSLVMALVVSAPCAPIAVELSTTDLNEALGVFSVVSFNAYAKWESTGGSANKIQVADGATTAVVSTAAGRGITWQSNGPQEFFLNFDGTTVSFSVRDGNTTHTASFNPASTVMNSILLILRARSGLTKNGGWGSSIAVTGMEIDSESVNIATISLTAAATSESDQRRFLLIKNVSAPFSMTGFLAMDLTRAGTGQHAPSLQLLAGVSPLAASDVPEPGTVMLLGIGLLALGAGVSRRRAGTRG